MCIRIIHLYINLRRSHDCFCFYVKCVSATRFITSFGQLLRCAHKRIVNTIKVYMERNNMQVELRRFRRKDIDFIDVGNFEV